MTFCMRWRTTLSQQKDPVMGRGTWIHTSSSHAARLNSVNVAEWEHFGSLEKCAKQKHRMSLNQELQEITYIIFAEIVSDSNSVRSVWKRTWLAGTVGSVSVRNPSDWLLGRWNCSFKILTLTLNNCLSYFLTYEALIKAWIFKTTGKLLSGTKQKGIKDKDQGYFIYRIIWKMLANQKTNRTGLRTKETQTN